MMLATYCGAIFPSFSILSCMQGWRFDEKGAAPFPEKFGSGSIKNDAAWCFYVTGTVS